MNLQTRITRNEVPAMTPVFGKLHAHLKKTSVLARASRGNCAAPFICATQYLVVPAPHAVPSAQAEVGRQRVANLR
jgi:hypothetical protein